MAGSSSGQYRKIVGVGELGPALKHAIRFRGKRAEERLKAALEGIARVSLFAVSQRLGWPVATVRSLYRKLEFRGEPLPELANASPRTKVQMTCPHCLRVRFLSPKVALELETDVCFECLHRPPVRTSNRLVAVCPQCGARRLLAPNQVARRSSGLETLCRRCSMTDGRIKGIEASRARRGLR